MKKQLKQLEEFHKAFGLYMNECPTLRIPQELHELRMRVMKEEVDEYAEEYAITGDSEDARLQAVAKELADIAYTLLGTVVSHGLQDEFERILTRLEFLEEQEITIMYNLLSHDQYERGCGFFLSLRLILS